MPGSGSTGQEAKEEERSMTQEPDPESDMNVTLKRLMRNPNMTSGGKELLSNLSNITKNVGLKMVRTSRIFEEKKRWEFWTVEQHIQ